MNLAFVARAGGVDPFTFTGRDPIARPFTPLERALFIEALAEQVRYESRPSEDVPPHGQPTQQDEDEDDAGKEAQAKVDLEPPAPTTQAPAKAPPAPVAPKVGKVMFDSTKPRKSGSR